MSLESFFSFNVLFNDESEDWSKDVWKNIEHI